MCDVDVSPEDGICDTVGSGTVDFSVPPTINVPPHSSLPLPTFTGSCLNGTTINATIFPTGEAITTSCLGGAYTITPTQIIPDGAYTVTVYQTDTVNVSPNIVGTGIIDTTPVLSPVCTATPLVTSGATTIECVFVLSGAAITIPSFVCSPSPATSSGTTTCVGTAMTSNPMFTLLDEQNNTDTGIVLLTLDTTPPPMPIVDSLSPDPALSGATVTLILSQVESGATVSVPSLTCSPSPAIFTRRVVCVGIATP